MGCGVGSDYDGNRAMVPTFACRRHAPRIFIAMRRCLCRAHACNLTSLDLNGGFHFAVITCLRPRRSEMGG